MVFSSFPVYLDHPNLHQLQQPDGHQQGNTGLELPTVQPPPPMQVGASPGSIRPGSMVDRARLAKIPLPEAGLKCPRCDSTNTKFCYFNNYNLSQPRHFCKTCRRYWTRGGALRSVPVGGGCRRNKRSKSSSNNNNNSSKSTGVSNVNTNTIASGTSTSASPSSCSTEIMNGRHHFPHEQPTQLTPLMAAFQNLNHHYGGFQPNLVSTHHGNGSALSSHHHEMGFQIGNSTNTNNTNNLPVPSGGGGSDHQWRLPSLAANTNLYPFQHGSDQGIHESSSGNNNINGHHDEQGLNSTKQFLGTMENNSNQYWGGNAWTGGFSGLNSSSSASHLL